VSQSKLVVIPVRLPPGLARFVTMPLSTGFADNAMTIGIVAVVNCA
jgi:hypothetical protein